MRTNGMSDPDPTGSVDALDDLPDSPVVSVVITTYDEEIYDDFAACVKSVLEQTYAHIEVVIVTETAHANSRVSKEFAEEPTVTHVHSERSLNLASARNLGAKHASGDVYAFIDDDAVADTEWIARIVDVYRNEDALAVGGKLTAKWPAEEPRYLPPEFYWLVGVTHKGFREDAGPVRNTFGANITFRAAVFDELGGYNVDFGKDHGHNLQGEETELCARLYHQFGTQLYYSPEATVSHRVYEWQLSWTWLFDRAYWQGVTKKRLQESVPNSTETEANFLKMVLFSSLPLYLKTSLVERSHVPLLKAICLSLLTFCVGAGFVAASIRAVGE